MFERPGVSKVWCDIDGDVHSISRCCAGSVHDKTLRSRDFRHVVAGCAVVVGAAYAGGIGESDEVLSR